jgi:class 3 adenylate cyclase
VEHPAQPIQVRIVLHTGEVIKEKGEFMGRAVNLAARIAAKAKGGEVLGFCDHEGNRRERRRSPFR